ncbi:MAG TPA: hypothetical protein VLU91_09020 [Nitrososphaerales archaeon]|nr:hypothetical protein [Nitrososphaerales archaeon]
MSQITQYSDLPEYDLDMTSSSLVEYFEGGGRGKTYPDVDCEPKESFRAVAAFFASQ